ncbi:MAG: cyclase family protein [Nitrospirae bacterium]|nr:cyclase family protein [Nitrospirota bacterium]
MPRTGLHGIAPLVLLLVTGLWPACAPTRPPTLIDLTHDFSRETVYWPNNKHFQWEKTDWGTTPAGYWYASANFSASEHGGTHIDAPIHFGRDRRTVDQIPLERLTGPAIVIDVRSQCAANPDYELTAADLLAWESIYGRIQADALVLMYSGWGQRWPDPPRYLGSETPDDPRTLHFPGFSREAAEFLVTQRSVRGVGIDTASIDPGRSRDFPAHRVLNGADVYALENVAALEQLPPKGATVWSLPIKIKGGTGGPVRIVAVLP